MIKTILFDFGGTLDTDGIHWSEKFWDVYQMFNLPVTKDVYNKAYVYAEPYIKRNVGKDDGLLKTLEAQVSFQFKYLVDKGCINSETAPRTANEIAYQCFKDVCKNIIKVKPFLAGLKKRYSLGLVSNYYGNIETVLKDLTIMEFFDVIVDSSVVNLFKPDPEIFAEAMRMLNAKAEETLVIGDSYVRDIVPAKKLGCNTIWLKVKSWREFSEDSSADYIIKTITGALPLLTALDNSNPLK